MRVFAALPVLVSLAAALPAQTAPPQKPQPVETLIVVGEATPVPLADSSASVQLIPMQPELLNVGTPVDLLRTDASLFIEQRGAGGAQSDIVLRGGTFAQTLVLVNGFRINDSQAAHHNLDLPIPLEAMDQIQVLHGAGSTLHGADALGGVVDFVTAAPKSTSLFIRAGAGNFGQNEQSLMAGGAYRRVSGRITGDRNFSTGFMTDRDYRNEDTSAEGWLGSKLGITDLLFATSDRSFGANQFYGPYPEWERTKSWFASARQELGNHTVAGFGYRRHTDEFVLIRTNPSIYENNHIDSSWQSSLQQTQSLGHGSLLLMGLEADGDSIHSNNLGTHARNRGAGYADLDLRPAAHRWTLSAGLRGEMFSGGDTAFSPHLAGMWRVARAVKLRATSGYGYRIPTYTDLYYSDPTTTGNSHLKPESAWSGEGGADWAALAHLMLSVTGFYSRQHDAIDYVRSSPATKWQAVNLNGLRFSGIESQITWQPARNQSVHIGWTTLFGAQRALHGQQSEYVFNYPSQNVAAAWNWSPKQWISFSNKVQIAQRYQRTPYAVWDAAIVRGSGRLRPYLRLQNLSNTGYEEISGVRMPSRSVMGGISFTLGR